MIDPVEVGQALRVFLSLSFYAPAFHSYFQAQMTAALHDSIPGIPHSLNTSGKHIRLLLCYNDHFPLDACKEETQKVGRDVNI